jgi:hypothetical protein
MDSAGIVREEKPRLDEVDSSSRRSPNTPSQKEPLDYLAWRTIYPMHDITRRGFTLSLAGALALRGQKSEDLGTLSLAEASARIRERTATPTQLTEACLARIEAYNPKLNAFITVLRDKALAQARGLGLLTFSVEWLG